MFTKEAPDLRILLVSISASSTFFIYSKVCVEVAKLQVLSGKSILSAVLLRKVIFLNSAHLTFALFI